jgi:hypothetical protein
MRTENTHVEVFDVEAQTALFGGKHKVTTVTHWNGGELLEEEER